MRNQELTACIIYLKSYIKYSLLMILMPMRWFAAVQASLVALLASFLVATLRSAVGLRVFAKASSKCSRNAFSALIESHMF